MRGGKNGSALGENFRAQREKNPDPSRLPLLEEILVHDLHGVQLVGGFFLRQSNLERHDHNHALLYTLG